MGEASIKQIVAMGGGGFSMEAENPLLDQYILGLAEKEKPRVCFLPTASGDSDRYIVRFYSAFLKFPCTPTHLSLFQPPTADLRSFVLEQDIIYVGGGNTRSLLALWREWEIDQILREAWEAGIVLAGLSAGSICWFEEGMTDSVPGSLNPLRCLGFLKGSHCPHYDGEAERRPAYQRLLSEGLISEGYAADDGVGLHFVGGSLRENRQLPPKRRLSA
ncbi:MAG: peptidase E [Pseudanabaenales cyanobacterium]|nr:peptidase E [Pseudanabaenales cyanobacterium]